MIPENVPLQYSIQGWLFGTLASVCAGWLLAKVKERPVRQEIQVPKVPVVPQSMRLLLNRPYIIYLLFRVPMTIAALLPASLLLDYVHYAMAVESYNLLYYLCITVVILSIFFSVPFLLWAAKKYGKRAVLTSTCVVEGIIFLVSFAMDPSAMLDGNDPPGPSMMILILCMFVGFGMAASFVLPDSVLADIIDYDELFTTERREGLYTVAETNLQQYIEIIGGVLPGIIAGQLGFKSNGGCDCGCGVLCDAEFTRWVCPGDVGYATLNELAADLVLGDPNRKAPCAIQNDGVNMTFRFFMLCMPGLCYLLAAAPAYYMAITKEKHDLIIVLLDMRDSMRFSTGTNGGERGAIKSFIDPLTDKPAVVVDNSAIGVARSHFTAYENGLAEKQGLAKLRSYLYGRVTLWSVLLAAMVTFCAVAISVDGINPEIVVTFCALGMAALFVLIPWDTLRARAVDTQGEALCAGAPAGSALKGESKAPAGTEPSTCFSAPNSSLGA